MTEAAPQRTPQMGVVCSHLRALVLRQKRVPIDTIAPTCLSFAG
jgi:hypothetical protein